MVMEATGDYWKPFYYLLEDLPGVEVMLVITRHVKTVLAARAMSRTRPCSRSSARTACRRPRGHRSACAGSAARYRHDMRPISRILGGNPVASVTDVTYLQVSGAVSLASVLDADGVHGPHPGCTPPLGRSVWRPARSPVGLDAPGPPVASADAVPNDENPHSRARRTETLRSS